MNIIVNYEIFALQKYGGISRYYIELANAIKKSAHSVKVLAPVHINKYLPAQSNDMVSTAKVPFLYRNFIYDFSDQQNRKQTQNYLESMKVDILHLTYYTSAPFPLTTAKKVITIHDMIYELFPMGLPEIDHVVQCKKKYIADADLIIAVSENTKKDLVEMYPAAEGKTTVVLHGINTTVYDHAIAYSASEPYLLYVGSRNGYKNFQLLIEIYKQSPALHEKYRLICFGGDEFNSSEIEIIGNFRDRVQHLNGDDAILASVYKGAHLFVYPSSYEGFGMPVLEAMAAGCPVVCANSSSLPEVAGDAAFYFPPDVPEQMKMVLIDACENAELRKSMVQKGLKRVKEFTWDICAQKTIEAYQKLLDK
ncbi:MAG: glycosyltransferase family 4 protein [Bacteroidota bacterium]|nr:glycosyltransferase family 4 protein [Bacteroidota bacterium]